MRVQDPATSAISAYFLLRNDRQPITASTATETPISPFVEQARGYQNNPKTHHTIMSDNNNNMAFREDSAASLDVPTVSAKDDGAPAQRASQVSAQQSDKDEAAAIVAKAMADKEQREADAKRVQKGDMSKQDLQDLINAKLAASKKK